MGKDLVIVESPAKARTIGRMLGNKYLAKASMGHVRDLPKRKMGVATEDRTFKPTYSVPTDKRKVVAELSKASKEAEFVYLATDPDREGEAISWHLIQAAKIDESKIKRVVFHEITQNAIKEAFENPRNLDFDLVDAQQARRVLDRLVGYDLSPVLWKKVKGGLSAGRVQSVAVRMIVDREMEIKAFKAREYWSIKAALKKNGVGDKDTIFEAQLITVPGEKSPVQIPDGHRANGITSALEKATYEVTQVLQKETRRKPAAPFITSTLQQEAWRKLRFSARKTMSVAQQLYEGIELDKEGPIGLITYMRTDSTTVANTAIDDTREHINAKFGPEFLPKSPRLYTKKVKGAQEAHEAIRPTSINRNPDSIKSLLSQDQIRLYELIWRRMLASQMSDAIFNANTINIDAKTLKSSEQYQFRVTGSTLKFPGFQKVYLEDKDETVDETLSDKDTILPALKEKDLLDCQSLIPEQHFTKPPPRFTDASLVRSLEELGIGRPSTYAPTMATVLDREYVQKERGRFLPTKLGIVVNKLLTAHFPDIIDSSFTARVEEELDEIARGEREWIPVIGGFYEPFNKSVINAMEQAERVPRDQIDEESDEVCEVCERHMVIKSGRFGKFLSCSGFPDCKNSRPLLNRTGVKCPDCNNDLVERRGRRKGARTFFGCLSYPNCTFAVSRRPVSQPCPECGGLLLTFGPKTVGCHKCEFNGPMTGDEPKPEPAEVAR